MLDMLQKYTLYYDYIEQHTVVDMYQMNMSKIQTDQTSLLLGGLNSCEDYILFVQVTSPAYSVLSRRTTARTGRSMFLLPIVQWGMFNGRFPFLL